MFAIPRPARPADFTSWRARIPSPALRRTIAAALPCKDIAAAAAALADEVQGRASGKPYRASEHAFIRAAAKDLLPYPEHMHKTRYFFDRDGHVFVGARQPAKVHRYADAINRRLDKLIPDYKPVGDWEHVLFSEEIASLVADVNAGKVNTLLILGGNPGLHRPGGPAFRRSPGKGAIDDSTRLVPERNDAVMRVAYSAGPFPRSMGRLPDPAIGLTAAWPNQ